MNTSSTAASTPSAVWAERAGTRQHIGRNSSGAEVRVGTGPSEFSLGELMEIALATCNTLSIDHRLAKALDEDFEATVGCSAVKDDAEGHYGSSQAGIITDLSSLDAERRELLSQRAAGAISHHYIVGHTIEHSASYTTTIVDPNES